jgi:hypothetical protein
MSGKGNKKAASKGGEEEDWERLLEEERARNATESRNKDSTSISSKPLNAKEKKAAEAAARPVKQKPVVSAIKKEAKK